MDSMQKLHVAKMSKLKKKNKEFKIVARIELCLYPLY